MTAVCLLIAVLLSLWTMNAEAAAQNIQYPHGVTQEMCRADYWIGKRTTRTK